jgi:hypothetical protein
MLSVARVANCNTVACSELVKFIVNSGKDKDDTKYIRRHVFPVCIIVTLSAGTGVLSAACSSANPHSTNKKLWRLPPSASSRVSTRHTSHVLLLMLLQVHPQRLQSLHPVLGRRRSRRQPMNRARRQVPQLSRAISQTSLPFPAQYLRHRSLFPRNISDIAPFSQAIE